MIILNMLLGILIFIYSSNIVSVLKKYEVNHSVLFRFDLWWVIYAQKVLQIFLPLTSEASY